jgi:hypothetical protein
MKKVGGKIKGRSSWREFVQGVFGVNGVGILRFAQNDSREGRW